MKLAVYTGESSPGGLMKEITREQLDQALANIAHLRELRAKQDKLFGELELALCFQYLWPEWSEGKKRGVQLWPKANKAVPQWSNTAVDRFRDRMELTMWYEQDGNRVERKIPATDLPEPVWKWGWEQWRKS